MQKLLLILIISLPFLAGCREPGAPVNSSGNTTYYVDAVGGNDTNNGTGQSTAWKTFARVNATTFQAGDKILLKSGCTWTGQLHPLGNGTSASPITLSSYGDAGKPVINGNGIAGAAVLLKNQSYWTINGLEITNTATTRSLTYRWGIQVENSNGGVTSGIRITNNDVHHVTGSFRWADGFIGPHLNGGIGLNVTGTTGTDKFNDVVIEGNKVSYSGRTGIVVWDNIWNGTNLASTQVLVRNNRVEFIDSDGILAYGCDGAILEYNVANTCGNYAEEGQFNGSCAIWCTRGRACISQFNEAYNTKALLDNVDGQGFDIDLDCTDCIVQYNYSHDNEGGFLLLIDAKGSPGVYNGTNGSIVRYNISRNDKTRIINFAGGVAPNSQIYNNTFYIGTGLATNILDHSWDLDMTQPYFFKNNIIYNLGSGNINVPGTGGTFDYNLYFGNHPAGEPAEAHKLTSDPLLVNASAGDLGLNSVDGFKLGTASPAAGSGVPVANPGSRDYWATAISPTLIPSRGAHYVPGGPASGQIETTVDNLSNFTLSQSHTANILLDTSNPAYFDGDASRITRSSGSAGSIVYQFNNISTFALKTYEFGADIPQIRFFTSPDGSSWTQVTTTNGTPVATASGWYKNTSTSSGTLPSGSTYLKIELFGTTAWGTQIGEVSITHSL